MTLFGTKLIESLPADADAKVEVRHVMGKLARISPVTLAEAVKLIQNKLVSGEVTRDGRLKYLRLVVHLTAAERVLGRAKGNANG